MTESETIIFIDFLYYCYFVAHDTRLYVISPIFIVIGKMDFLSKYNNHMIFMYNFAYSSFGTILDTLLNQLNLTHVEKFIDLSEMLLFRFMLPGTVLG